MLRDGLTENWEVFVVVELLLWFLPDTYFGKPLACKSNEGYLLAILLERVKVVELTKFSKALSSWLFFKVILFISE